MKRGSILVKRGSIFRIYNIWVFLGEYGEKIYVYDGFGGIQRWSSNNSISDFDILYEYPRYINDVYSEILFRWYYKNYDLQKINAAIEKYNKEYKTEIKLL